MPVASSGGVEAMPAISPFTSASDLAFEQRAQVRTLSSLQSWLVSWPVCRLEQAVATFMQSFSATPLPLSPATPVPCSSHCSACLTTAAATVQVQDVASASGPSLKPVKEEERPVELSTQDLLVENPIIPAQSAGMWGMGPVRRSSEYRFDVLGSQPSWMMPGQQMDQEVH